MKLKYLLLLVLLAGSACSVLSPKKSSGKDELVTISTPQGDIKMVLFDDTPQHKENFLKLAREGFYNGTTFHRVIPGFMIQGGDPNTKDNDPNNDGTGNPGYTVPAEINPKHTHVHGAVAAARMGDQVNPSRASSGSQFYIVENMNGTPQLDGAYTVFGQVVEGLDVVSKIAGQPTGARNRPRTDIPMTVKVESLKKKKIADKYKYTYPGES